MTVLPAPGGADTKVSGPATAAESAACRRERPTRSLGSAGGPSLVSGRLAWIIGGELDSNHPRPSERGKVKRMCSGGEASPRSPRSAPPMGGGPHPTMQARRMDSRSAGAHDLLADVPSRRPT